MADMIYNFVCAYLRTQIFTYKLTFTCNGPNFVKL